MKTITVLSRKGGSGKTTVSVSLALAARQAGLKAVLADIDPLHSAGEVLGARPEAQSLLFETTGSRLHMLQEVCPRHGCDMLVIDTPTAPDREVILAANAADLCLIVARPAALDVAAVSQSIDLVAQVGIPGLIVLNQCPPLRNGVEPLVVQRACGRLLSSRVPFARTRLRSRVAYQHAFGEGSAVTEWDPFGDAAADVLRLLAEISDHLLLPSSPARADLMGGRELQRVA